MLAVFGVWLYLGSSPALAARPHIFEKSFGEAGIGNGQLLEPSGVAVNEATGDVYVLDQGNDRVEWFSSTGEYRGQFDGSKTPAKAFSFGGEALNGGVAVDNSCYFKKLSAGACSAADPSDGDVYLTDSGNGVIDKFSSTGIYIGQLKESEPGSSFGALDGVAVDPGGEVWVYQENGHIDNFSNALANEFQKQRESPRGTLPGFAVDSEDNLYVRNGEPTITKASVSGEELIGSLDEETSTAVAVDLSGEDGSSNDIYVDNVTSVGKFSTTGSQSTLLERFGSGHLTSGTGIAVSSSSGDVYVAEATADVVNVFIPQPVPPTIDSTSTGTVTSNSADLSASINPNGEETTCKFEYGTSASYGASVPCKPADLGSGQINQTVTQQVAGLQPSTTYHFRVVAHNITGTAISHDDTFVYDTTPGRLPDERVYEMVTPAQKAGSFVGSLPGTVAADGSSLAGASTGAFAGLSNEELPPLGQAFYRFTRTVSGWTTAPLSIPRGDAQSIGVEDSVWSPANLGVSVNHLSLRQTEGAVSDIGPVWPPALGSDPTQSGVSYSVQGAAGEASHGVVFSIGEPSLLWRSLDSTVSPPSLYEYTGTGNSAPSLVGVSGADGTTLIGQCGTEFGAPSHVFSGSRYNAMSQDGQVVFFTVDGADHASCAGTQPAVDEMFARVDESRTVAISEPSSADCSACNTAAPMDAIFEGASADGSKVFFTTAQPLLSGDSDTTTDLYEYDSGAPAGKRMIQVSAGGSGDATPGAGAEVEGVSRISEDGSHVYFVAHGVLTTRLGPDAQGYGEHGEPVETGAVAQPGAENLYVYDTETGTIWFIADLCSGPEASGSTADSWCPSSLNSKPWNDGSESHNDQALWEHGAKGGDDRPVQSTPKGRSLVFTSYGDLTADDTSTAQQVFQYDAQTGALVRVSIGQDGLNNNGNTDAGGASIVTPQYDETGGQGGFTRGGALARTMSDDGSYVFFQSPVGLTSHALDDVVTASFQSVVNPGETITDYAQNVYEYHAGHVYLISDGQDVISAGKGESMVKLIGTDASGADVFFTSADPLIPQDADTQEENIYDARIGGGFPPLAASAACQGEACQGTQGASSPFGAPSSSTFSGPGNPVPPASKPVPKPKTAAQVRAEKLAKALRSCRKEKSRKKRRACESRARKSFGAAARANSSGKVKKATGGGK